MGKIHYLTDERGFFCVVSNNTVSLYARWIALSITSFLVTHFIFSSRIYNKMLITIYFLQLQASL